MGGRSSSGNRNTGSNSVSDKQVFKIAQDWVSHNLSVGEQFAKATNAEIVSDIDENGRANVKIDYETRVRVVVGYDAETQRMEYEEDTEYRTDTVRLKVR